MEKEFYKLVLTAIMVVSSFSLAFFLGRKITLSDKALVPPSASSPDLAETAAIQPAIELKNTAVAIENDIEEVPPADLYVWRLKTFGDKEKAMEHSTQIKLKFPDWPVFFKKSGAFYKVYTGPFNSLPKARRFLKRAKAEDPLLPSAVLEKLAQK